MPRNNSGCRTERGNVFLVILLGVALFAALALTVARGMRSSNTTTLSTRDAELAATEILAAAQNMEKAVSKVMRKGCSENTISFWTDTDGDGSETSSDDYYNDDSPPDHTCHIFETAGGGTRLVTFPSDISADPWYFTGGTCITDVGTGNSGCSGDGEPNEELLAILPGVNAAVCIEINKRLGIEPMPTYGGPYPLATNTFDGSYTPDREYNSGTPPHPSGCLKHDTNYSFYSVLMAR
jgi:hypothetical protein